MSDVLATIDAEDLARSRQLDARIQAMRLLPTAYGGPQIEEAFLKSLTFAGEMMKKYGLPENGRWFIDPETGAVLRNE